MTLPHVDNPGQSWTDEVVQALAAPFPEKDVSWVIVATKNKNKPDHTDLWAPYLDADAIRGRLDQVCGPGGWAVDIEAASPTSIICRLAILGVTRADVGDGKDADQPLKAAATDAIKRAAINFGIGRYLHNVPKQWLKPDSGRPPPPRQGPPHNPQASASHPSPPRPPPPTGARPPVPPTAGPEAPFRALLAANDMSANKAANLLGAMKGGDPNEALRIYVAALPGTEEQKWKKARDNLSGALADEALAS